MAQQHIHKLGEAQVGDTVKVQVHDVDRGHADILHILAYILKVNKENGSYQLATKHGILDGWQSRNMFEICKQKLISFESLDLSVTHSLRKLNELHSLCGGQWFQRCNCSGKCERNCSCKKNLVFCNSKCHKNKNNTCCTNKS